MSILGVVLIVILILILAGGLGGPYLGAPWTYGYGLGHGSIGVVGVLLIIIVVLLLLGRI